MQLVKDREALNQALEGRAQIGFVPTMGALHEGHLSLVQESKRRSLHTVASIFINPTQFNNPDDLDAYPIDTEEDLRKLEAAGCDLVFLPSKESIYPSEEEAKRYLHHFGPIEERYEGAFRPGHFKGVGQVVHILFELVKPQVAFFGQKDFQQLQVIRKLVEMLELQIEIVGMPTVREEDGLAMSSRNRRLNPSQRKAATLLHASLQLAKQELGKRSIMEIQNAVKQRFQESRELELEYFDIIDPKGFEALDSYQEGMNAHGIISAFAGEVRLIDNLELASQAIPR